MPVTFHPDGGILIDDPELEKMIADTCKITGETPEAAVHWAVLEALERRGPDARATTKATS